MTYEEMLRAKSVKKVKKIFNIIIRTFVKCIDTYLFLTDYGLVIVYTIFKKI